MRLTIVFIMVMMLLTACSWSGGSSDSNAGEAQTATATANSRIEIVSAGLLASRSGEPELGLTLSNTASQTVWVQVHYQTPGQISDCLLYKELAPAEDYFYRCPQTQLSAGNYRVVIDVYADAAQNTRLEQLETNIVLQSSDLAVFKK